MERPTATYEEEEQDEYYEYNDERPSLDPEERPTEQRGERPMRLERSRAWGPGRQRSR
ncbi:MAG TPA: hypothetical protein VMB76_06610 [Casimicrobiaceae bacterium]|jgi:hypothetical protein|nr:hypothetical protein [Casimicrobiaceae bacterium]